MRTSDTCLGDGNRRWRFLHAWFCLVAFALAAYVVLDGYDLGSGILHLLVARSDDERRQVFRSIGPVWDGNEVWLLAAGGTIFLALPVLYASSVSGFYLPLMMILWLLVLRGISIDLRDHLASPAWTPLWDTGFVISSALLSVFLGVALGNVVRGVPLGPDGWFFLPLFTDFDVGPSPGILDWYTLSAGATAFLALALHGALWLVHRTTVEVQRRSARLVPRLWAGLLAGTILITVETFFAVQPLVPASFVERPWGWVFPAFAVAGLAGALFFAMAGRHDRALMASSAYLAGMMASAAFGLYPYVLPSSTDPALGLTVFSAKAPDHGLAIGLIWWPLGMAGVLAYTIWVHRHFRGRVDDGGY